MNDLVGQKENLDKKNNEEEYSISCDHSSDSVIDEERREFSTLVGIGCGVACACYAAYKAIAYIAPSADAQAEATTEVNIKDLQPGQSKTVTWRGAPVVIKYRTQEELEAIEKTDISTLRDPETDDQRVLKGHKNLLVVVNVCTHLGCIPIGDDGRNGQAGGWFCPCHGSHYDASGRIISGPAPKNLFVPKYKFLNDDTILIGEA